MDNVDHHDLFGKLVGDLGLGQVWIDHSLDEESRAHIWWRSRIFVVPTIALMAATFWDEFNAR